MTEIDAVLSFEVVGHVVDEDFVEVVAAQVRVAVRADYFEDAVRNLQNGNVERAAAEVEYDDLLVDVFVEPVSERRSRRFVDDSFDFQTGDLARVFRRLTLRVVEVRRYGNDRLIDSVAEVRLGRFLKFAQRFRGNLRGRVRFAVDFYFDVIFADADDLVRNRRLF